MPNSFSKAGSTVAVMLRAICKLPALQRTAKTHSSAQLACNIMLSWQLIFSLHIQIPASAGAVMNELCSILVQCLHTFDKGPSWDI